MQLTVFLHNIEAINAGCFDATLLNSKGEPCRLLDMYKQIVCRYVFRHLEVEQLELQGYRVIHGLLDAYKPMLEISTEQFLQLAHDDHLRNEPIITRLYHRLSQQHCQAYKRHTQVLSQTLSCPSEIELW